MDRTPFPAKKPAYGPAASHISGHFVVLFVASTFLNPLSTFCLLGGLCLTQRTVKTAVSMASASFQDGVSGRGTPFSDRLLELLSFCDSSLRSPQVIGRDLLEVINTMREMGEKARTKF